MNNILKITAMVISGLLILSGIFIFQKEIFDWADKPADNASVILIVVFVCYIFSLPVTFKLNRIIDLLEDNDSNHGQYEE